MSSSVPRRRRRCAAVALAASSATLLALALVPSSASAVDEPAAAAAPELSEAFAQIGLDDIDARTGLVVPSAAQKTRVAQLKGTVRWNRFGTPQSLINHSGLLGSGYSSTDAVGAARTWLKQNASLFRLTAAQVDALELVNDQRMAQSDGHAVLFRQKFGNLRAAVDGMVTVGVVKGKIAYVSSSLVGTSAAPSAGSLTGVQAWLKAAANVGRPVSADSVGALTDKDGWTRFKVAGFAQEQMARKVALPMPNGTVRSVWEVNVVDVAGARTLAYTSFVDAASGAVLVRHNQVDNASEATTFTGTYSAAQCGPRHPVDADADTKTIIVGAQPANAANDIVIKLYKGSGTEPVATQDLLTSPEALVYEVPPGGAPAIYNVEICSFEGGEVLPPANYVGVASTSDQTVAEAGVPYPPKWNYFLSNPTPNFSPTHTPTNRKLGCWEAEEGCDNPPTNLQNMAARGPWDFNFRTNTPTFTTNGNAAETREAWLSPLTPGGGNQRPVSQDRVYGVGNAEHPLQGFTDAWNNTKCSPEAFTPERNNNDILAATTSLFANHNQMHDWSYFLGFTESNYNLQDNNFGNDANGVVPGTGELDPEIGNVQAGALTGGQPSFLGRDNANQITLQDGTPGITNQYLFQPIAGAFYAPCVDGDYDMSIVGHEYNHAISNRMVGGPDAGLTAFQGRSMGEAWGDQIALEYQWEHNYGLLGGTVKDSLAKGQNHWVEGVYATGNKVTGIRNYSLNNGGPQGGKNPLQYGDLGYDIPGPEVHSDGEPWNIVMWDVRQALVNKYNAKFPETNFDLQRRCAQGNSKAFGTEAPLNAHLCPGNRRWIQMVFDAYLLQPANSGMLDARDAMLASDRMRFAGANQAVMWNAFAKRGYGSNAAYDAAGSDGDQPVPGYMSPFSGEGTLNLKAPAGGKLFLGQYEARVTPVADNDPKTAVGTSLKLVPGTYQFVFQAKGYGLTRFTQTIAAGQTVTKNLLALPPNLASSTRGATIEQAATTADSKNTSKLIDDTEASNWAGKVASGTSVDTAGNNPFITVNLAGNTKVNVGSVRVSALLRPADPAQEEDEPQPDDGPASRFTALRHFAIATCSTGCASAIPAGQPGSPFTVVYDSRTATGGGDSARAPFDSTLPRPLAPDLILKSFDVTDSMATHVQLIALENQCTGTPEYAGDQDNDLSNNTDCKSGSTRDQSVRAAELQVFSQ